MKQRVIPVIAVLIVGLASLAGGLWTSMARSSAGGFTVQGLIKQEFTNALSIFESNYAGKLDFEVLGKTSMQGMLRQLDPHSSYFTSSEFEELRSEQRSLYYGIGVTILKVDKSNYVIAANPDGPAQKAGLRYGDAIVAVDGQPAQDWSTDQVIQSVRGEKGESVQLTVARAGMPPFTVKITRGEVKLPSVRNAFILDQNGTGYIALTGGFSRKTDEEVAEALDRLKRDGMRQLVLDLRGNPGGLLDEAVRVAEKFLLPGAKIVEVRGRQGFQQPRTYEVPRDNKPEMIPMVVLIDGRSASASEVVAGALQDHDRALIIGENSFGKGLVQTVYPLWGGTGLTLTTAKYYTPSGRLIQRDYSVISFYDYHLNRGDGEIKAQRGDAVRTDLGRAVYGGGGINPDLEVKSSETNPVRRRLFYALFDFSRHLVNGQLPGFREYRVAEADYKAKLTSDDLDLYPITDKLIAAFRQRLSETPEYNITDDRFNAALDYIKLRLRTEIMTAAFGPELGQQVYLVEDTQLRRAVEKLPEARQLAEQVSHLRSANN